MFDAHAARRRIVHLWALPRVPTSLVARRLCSGISTNWSATMRTWPADWDDRRRGVDCIACKEGRPDKIPNGQRVFAGRWSMRISTATLRPRDPEREPRRQQLACPRDGRQVRLVEQDRDEVAVMPSILQTGPAASRPGRRTRPSSRRRRARRCRPARTGRSRRTRWSSSRPARGPRPGAAAAPRAAGSSAGRAPPTTASPRDRPARRGQRRD